MKKLLTVFLLLVHVTAFATVPTDPGTGLQDLVDYTYLSGTTGLHARFSPLYNVLNGGLDSTNMNLGANFTWTGNHVFNGTVVTGITQAGQVSNCGISVSGSTFTIAGSDGTALSSTNPCKIGIKSNTAGRVAIASFISNVTFTFGSSSDTDGNLFGVTDADWSNAMPFFLGVIYNGTTPYFTISRVPSYVSGAAATALCQKGDTDCDAQADTMILTTGLTLSSWVNLPITQVGWFQMTYATSGGAWTATTSIHAGFNKEYEKIEWTFPTGQMGAASGKYLLAVGGDTAAVFSTNHYYYYINSYGEVDLKLNLTGDGGTDGSGGAAIEITMPYLSNDANAFSYSSIFDVLLPTTEYLTIAQTDQLNNIFFLQRHSNSTTNLQTQIDFIRDSDLGNGNRNIKGSLSFHTL